MKERGRMGKKYGGIKNTQLFQSNSTAPTSLNYF